MSTPTLTDIDVQVTVTDRPDPAPPQGSGPLARRRRGRGRRRTWRTSRFAYALIAPAVVFMVLVHLLPAIGGLILSFKNLNTFTFSQLYGAPWAGLQNYRAILFDGSNPLHSGFFGAVENTVVYTFWTVGLTLSGGLAVALLVKRPMRGQKVVRTLMLTPWIVPSYVVAVLWGFMWQSDVGIVNKVLVDYTHVLSDRPVWLLGPHTMWAIIVPSVWRGLPFAMLIFLAGLQALPKDLYDAAAIDGAGALRRFRYITLPLMRPLIAIQLLFGVIYSAYQFAIPYVMLGTNPGPDADLMMTLIVRQSFSNNLFGFGAAASTLLMLGMLVWVAVWYRAFRRDLEATS
jgi:multiple sugar transport system permease protein